MTDRVIDSIEVHLAASKSSEFRERVRRRFRTLIDFLQDNNLTTRLLLPKDQEPPDTFKIMQSDLTSKGFELLKTSYYKWMDAHDRGKPIEDTTLLEKALKRLA